MNEDELVEIKELKAMTPFEDYLEATMLGQMEQTYLFTTFLSESFYMPVRTMFNFDRTREFSPIISEYDGEHFLLIFSLKMRMKFFENRFASLCYETGQTILEGLPERTGIILNPESNLHFFIGCDKVPYIKSELML